MAAAARRAVFASAGSTLAHAEHWAAAARQNPDTVIVEYTPPAQALTRRSTRAGELLKRAQQQAAQQQQRPDSGALERLFAAVEQHWFALTLSLVMVFCMLRVVSAYGEALAEVNLKVDHMAALAQNIERMDAHFPELDPLLNDARLLQARSRLWLAFDLAWQHSPLYVFVSQHNAILAQSLQSLLQQHMFSGPLLALLVVTVIFIFGRTVVSIARAYMHRQGMREMGQALAGELKQHRIATATTTSAVGD
jgi:hypothetical protein